MVISGYARALRGDLHPAEIINPGIAALGDPALLAAYCLAEVDQGFGERAGEGDILVLDGALLSGSGAETAVIALQSVGIAAVVCAHATPELVEAGARYGLPVLAVSSPGAIAEGAVVRLDLERGRLEVGLQQWTFWPLALEALAAARRAQILARMRRVAEDEGYAE